MKRFALPVLLSLVLLGLGSGGASAAPKASLLGDPELQQAQERVQRLHQDISLINLLNGLHLTREQMTKLLALAREARQVREQLFSQQYRADLREAETAFTALKQEIQQGAPAKGEVPAQAARVNHRLKEVREQNWQQLAQSCQSLEARLGQVLTPEQVQVVQSFTPCLIPPKDLRDPVRAGQAAPHEGVVHRLRQLRALPEDRWQAFRDRIVDRVVEKISQKVKPLTAAEKQQEKSRLLSLADRVRQMPEADFEMAKENLVAELAPQSRLKELKAELEARGQHLAKAHRSPLARYFLNDRIIPILEERLARGNMAGLQ